MTEPEPKPEIDIDAYRELLAALECLAEVDILLPMDIDPCDLLDLARRVVVRR